MYQYHVIGGRFDRKFIPVKEEQIARSERPPRGYVVRLSDFYEHRLDTAASQSEMREFEARMERLGYEKVASNSFCTMMRPGAGHRDAIGRDGTAVR